MLKMQTKHIGVREYRQNLASLHRKALKQGVRYVIVHRNEPILEVKPLTKRQAALEKLAADIAHARSQVRRGETYSLDEIEKMFGLK